MDATGPGQPATCAVHAGQPAAEVCQRCGNLMCDACSLNRTSPRCPRCREIAGTSAFPFTRDSWSVEGLFNHCWVAFKKEWSVLSLSVLVVMVIVVGMGLLGSLFQMGAAAVKSRGAALAVSVAFSILPQVVQGFLQLGLMRVCLDVHEGKKAEVARLFSQFSKLGKYILQILALVFAIGVPLGLYALLVGGLVYLTGGFHDDARTIAIIALASVPAVAALVYVSLGLVFALMELAYDDNVDAMGAIAKSWRLAEGKRLAILGMTVLCGLVAAAGLIACCVGILATAAFAQLVMAGLYLALRTPTRQAGGAAA